MFSRILLYWLYFASDCKWKGMTAFMETAAQIRARLERLPRAPLGFFPTPLHRADRLSQQLGIDLWLKRDDLTGVGLFGGNKIRKLEYVLGRAKADGCDTIVSYGASQSNCAMQVATGCRRLGLTPILYLDALVEPTEPRANLLLDGVLGAEIHLIPLNGGTEEEAEAEAVRQGRAHMARLEAAGHRCREVPMGAADAVGSAGFIGGWAELLEQLEQRGISADYLFHGTGTGGTLAGLAAGRMLSETGPEIIAVNVSAKNETYLDRVAELGTAALREIGSALSLTRDGFRTDLGYYGAGYEIPSPAATEAIQTLARTEGIFLDPVYTGKAFAGLLDYVKTGKIPQGSTVVFWHTGGATALFAEPAIVGPVAEG